MKLLNKIKAFFRVKGEELEMDVKAAEIKEGKAFLHPKGNEHVTYIVPSDDITIILNNKTELVETDVKVIERIKKENDINIVEEGNNKEKDILPKNPKEANEELKKLLEEEKDKKNKTKRTTQERRTYFDMEQYKKKSFTIKLYPDEYEAMIEIIKEFGYRREEFILACVTKANKRTVTSECKKLEKMHVQKKQEEETLKNTVIENNS